MKLVRDKIPDIIRETGAEPDVTVAMGSVYLELLGRKMGEELEEYMEEPSYEEAADMLEVFRALVAYHGLDLDEIERVDAPVGRELAGEVCGPRDARWCEGLLHGDCRCDARLQRGHRRGHKGVDIRREQREGHGSSGLEVVASQKRCNSDAKSSI